MSRLAPLAGLAIVLLSGRRSIASRLSQDGRGLMAPFGMAIAPSGDIYVAEGQLRGGLSGVVRVDSMLGTHRVLSEGDYFRTPAGIAIDEDGVLYVVDMDAFGGRGGVIRVEPETGAQSVVSFGGEFLDPIAIALTRDGELMVLDNQAGALISVDRDSLDQRLRRVVRRDQRRCDRPYGAPRAR